MIDSLAKLLIGNGLDPESFAASVADETMFRGEVPGGRAMQTWVNLAKASAETKYWPIIRGGPDDIYEPNNLDPTAILAAVPQGNIGKILRPRFEERRDELCEMIPEFGEASDMYQLGVMADASGVYSFSGRQQVSQAWPTEPTHQGRVSLQTVKERKGQPSTILLVRVEHSYDVPAFLGFGGWNDCPAPELHVAVLREWKNKYGARPACVTGDVLECVVVNRPQTEAEATKLAAEQWIFCDDIVGQGTQSIRKLAMEIWRAPAWFFWWD
jgi:hypothetical protein